MLLSHKIREGGFAMRTVGVILLTVLRFAVMLFVSVFLFLVKLALGGR